MSWKPVTGLIVFARLDGQVREVVVTAWDRTRIPLLQFTATHPPESDLRLRPGAPQRR